MPFRYDNQVDCYDMYFKMFIMIKDMMRNEKEHYVQALLENDERAFYITPYIAALNF